jgi:hypothetical protein
MFFLNCSLISKGGPCSSVGHGGGMTCIVVSGVNDDFVTNQLVENQVRIRPSRHAIAAAGAATSMWVS